MVADRARAARSGYDGAGMTDRGTTAGPAELTGARIQEGMELLGWTAGALADAAHLSIIEVEKVLEDRDPIFNAILNCVRALEAAGVRFERAGRDIHVRRAAL